MNKEVYFTPDTIREKSTEMLNVLVGFRKHHTNIPFDARRAALLVLDMQEYFLAPSSHAFVPSAPAIVPNIQSLMNCFQANRRPVIFTRHINSLENAGMMSRWWKDGIRNQSLESRILSSLDASNGIVVDKSQYDAFYESELQEILKSNAIEQVIVTGVMTHLCCETTARSAFVHGFEVFIVIDGTATYTESFHRASLQNLSHGFALPVRAEEILCGFE